MKTTLYRVGAIMMYLAIHPLVCSQDHEKLQKETYVAPTKEVGVGDGAAPVMFIFEGLGNSPKGLAETALKTLRAQGIAVPPSATWGINVDFREMPHACVVLISDLKNKISYSVLFNTNGTPMTVHRARHRHSDTMKLPQNLRELIPDILNTNSPPTIR
jgi:hypothetical protein